MIISGHCVLRPWHMQAPHIQRSNFRSTFLLLMSFQKTGMSPRSCAWLISCYHLVKHKSWRNIPCLLFKMPYAIYLQVTSISSDLFHNLKPEEEPCHGDREPPPFQGHKEESVTQFLVQRWMCSLCGKPNQ
jgi:hypothetical protein